MFITIIPALERWRLEMAGSLGWMASQSSLLGNPQNSKRLCLKQKATALKVIFWHPNACSLTCIHTRTHAPTHTYYKGNPLLSATVYTDQP